MNETLPTDNPTEIGCANCKARREKLQSIGFAIYFVSLFSCGLLMPIALPTGIIIQLLALRKCKECRLEAKRLKKMAADQAASAT